MINNNNHNTLQSPFKQSVRVIVVKPNEKNSKTNSNNITEEYNINLEENMTFESLFEIISLKTDYILTEYAFFTTLKDTDLKYSKRFNMKDFVLPNARNETLFLRLPVFLVTVLHLGQPCVIQVNPDDCLNDIRMAFEEKTNFKMEKSVRLSFRGEEIKDSKTIKDVNIIDACNQALLCPEGNRPKIVIEGQLQIHIQDKKAAVSHSLNIYPFSTVEEILRSFCVQSNRKYHPESQLIYKSILPYHIRVFDIEPSVRHNCYMSFEAASYQVEIRDLGAVANNSTNSVGTLTDYDLKDKDKVFVKVEDYWKADDLKKRYSQCDHVQPMLADDKFIFEKQIVDDNMMFYRLGLSEGSVLFVERAKETIVHDYICADCGSDVKLKPKDVVRCRHCFYRIVYKKRTDRICQYNCR